MNRELNDMKHFEYYYEKVKPIVLKLRRTYFVKCGIMMIGYKKGELSSFSFYKIIQNYLR